MRRLICLIYAVGLCAASARAGEPPDLLQGYDKVRWGQTAEEVRQVYGKKITEDKGGDGPAFSASLPMDVFVSELTLSDPQPSVSQVVFRFLEGRLCAVKAALTTEVQSATTNEVLAKILWEKYYADPEIRAQLTQHHLMVSLRYNGRNPEPQSPADLVPKERLIADVWYENCEWLDRQLQKAQERKQQEAERAKQAASEEKLKAAL